MSFSRFIKHRSAKYIALILALIILGVGVIFATFIPLVDGKPLIGGGTLTGWLHGDKVDTDRVSIEVEDGSQVTRVQMLIDDGDPVGAHREIDERLQDDTTSSDDRFTMLIQRGLLYEGEEKYSDALKAYHAAEAVTPSYISAEGIARTAAAAGDHSLAIEYYKKASERIPNDEPTISEMQAMYAEEIRVSESYL